MTAPTPTVVSWSGGKDSALSLSELRGDPTVDVVELITTVGAETDRSSMHGVRRGLYERQAAALDLSIRFVPIPDDASNEAYEERLAAVVDEYVADGVEAMAFADLYLEDVRGYRENRLLGTGLSGTWPLWGRPTDAVARAFVDAGFSATVVCVDDEALGPEFLGRPFDDALIEDLPDCVDPCGENGEFHTFVHDGPGFEEPVAVETRETVTRELGEGVYHYVDLVSVESDQ